MVGGKSLQILRHSFTAKVCGFGSWELYVGLYILKDLINSSHILLNNWWWWLMKDPVADAMSDKHRLKLIS